MGRWAGVLVLPTERLRIFKPLVKYAKGLTREVQVIHFRSSPRDPGELIGKKPVKYSVCAHYVVASLRSIEKTDGTFLC